MSKTFEFCPMCATELEAAMRGGHERRVCPACDFVWWDNPAPVVAAIVEHRDDVILVRNHGWPESWFGLVSGFLERDEAPEEGVLREIEEEIGLAGEVVELVGNYAFPQMHQVIMAYHVRATGTVSLGDEIAASKRVPIEKLKPWPIGTGHAVRDWLARRG